MFKAEDDEDLDHHTCRPLARAGWPDGGNEPVCLIRFSSWHW
jgi:hypothetical protein